MERNRIVTDTVPSMKGRLIRLLYEKGFKYTEEPTFKLVSGRMSHYYVNCRPVAMSPIGMHLIGHLVCAVLNYKQVTAVGGLTFGADPIACATAYTSQLLWPEDLTIKAFSIRKQLKDHGIPKWIEGDVLPDEKVAIIDDVATTGGSTITAIERARIMGLVVENVIILVDRQEGGIENIKQHVSDVSAIVTRDELMALRG